VRKKREIEKHLPDEMLQTSDMLELLFAVENNVTRSAARKVKRKFHHHYQTINQEANKDEYVYGYTPFEK